MDGLAFAAALSVMGAIVVGALAIFRSASGSRADLDRRLGIVLGESTGSEIALDQFAGLRAKRAGRLPIISALLEGKDWTEATAERLERADIRFTVAEFVAIRLILAALLVTLAFLFLGSGLPAILAMAAAAIAGYTLPSLFVAHATSRRVSKLSAQLPDALTLISNSIKAGFGLMQSLDLASKELAHPFATEIKRTLHDINVGAASHEALQDMAERCGSDDLDIVITAVLIQQSSGGNLSEILDNVAHTMRERIRIRGEIKTLTSQQLLTGFVIGGLPFAMVALFSLINPAYMEPLFTQTAGHAMIAAAAILEFFGIIMIRRILAIEV